MILGHLPNRVKAEDGAVSRFLKATTQGFGANAQVALPNDANPSASVTPIDGVATCSADVSGTWAGRLAFEVMDHNGRRRSAAAMHRATKINAAARNDGTYTWIAPNARSCQVTMASYRDGNSVALVPVRFRMRLHLPI
jgi:hypothetical protein